MADILYGLLLIAIIAISAICFVISHGLLAVNHYQLKREAQLGDKWAKAAYPLHMLRYQLHVNLMLVSTVANVLIVLLLVQKVGDVFALVFASAVILILGELLPLYFLRKQAVLLTGFLAPLLRKIMALTSPVVRPVANLLERSIVSSDSASYTKEQLVDMFRVAKLGTNTDIPTDELHMIRAMLGFGDKKIRDVMTPRRMVAVVSKDDAIGPIMMNELHKSGHSRFPVISESKHYNFVGTLYLRDLVGAKDNKKVKELMSPNVRYVHEEESLDHALRAFLKTHHHLFVVVNSFEEFVGVLSIEDVLEEVIGKEIVDEFDIHDDLRAVATSIAEKEKKLHLRAHETVKPSVKVVK